VRCAPLVTTTSRSDLLASPDAVPSYVYEATGASADDFTVLANRLMGREVRDVQLVQTGVITLPDLSGLDDVDPATASPH